VEIEETIQVRCSRCKLKFRDKARRVRDGYSRQCPSCERMLFFIDGSPNQDINQALREAERVGIRINLDHDPEIDGEPEDPPGSATGNRD